MNATHPRLLIPVHFRDSRDTLSAVHPRKRLRDNSQYVVSDRFQEPPKKRVKLASPSSDVHSPQQHEQLRVSSSTSPIPTAADPQFLSSLNRRNNTSPDAPQVGRSELKIKDASGKTKIIELTAERIRSLYHLPQPEAAQVLGIGLSTLKKHARILLPKERWPNPKQRAQLLQKKNLGKMRISFLVHEVEAPLPERHTFLQFAQHCR